MAGKKSSVYAVRQLKEMIEGRVDSEYTKEARDIEKTLNDYIEPRNKAVMKEIEVLVETKYPFLKHKKICDYHHSRSDDKTVTVAFDSEYTDDTVKEIKAQLNDVRNKHDARRQSIADWEFAAINAVARSEDIPEFNL